MCTLDSNHRRVKQTLETDARFRSCPKNDDRSFKHKFHLWKEMKCMSGEDEQEANDGSERNRPLVWLFLSFRSSEKGPGGTPYLAAEFAVLKAVQGDTREVKNCQ